MALSSLSEAVRVCCFFEALLTLSTLFIARTFRRCLSSSSSGTFSSILSMEALALTGAESMACVLPETIPLLTHRARTRSKSCSNSTSGNSSRVLLMVECHGRSSSMSWSMK